jgi:PBP1b-binding outer membrane lipoprotein LpoB
MIAKKMALIALTAVLLNGCSGLKFKDEKVNLSLPDDFRFRTPIKNTADLRFFMKENVGLLITPDGSSGAYKILAKPIVADDFQARERRFSS